MTATPPSTTITCKCGASVTLSGSPPIEFKRTCGKSYSLNRPPVSPPVAPNPTPPIPYPNPYVFPYRPYTPPIWIKPYTYIWSSNGVPTNAVFVS